MHECARRPARLKPVDILQIAQPHFCSAPSVPFMSYDDRHVLIGLHLYLSSVGPTHYTAPTPSAPSGSGGSVVVFEREAEDGRGRIAQPNPSPIDRRTTELAVRGGEAATALLHDNSFADGVQHDLGCVMQIQLLHQIGSMRFNC